MDSLVCRRAVRKYTSGKYSSDIREKIKTKGKSRMVL
jgi:hypothetical protein